MRILIAIGRIISRLSCNGGNDQVGADAEVDSSVDGLREGLEVGVFGPEPFCESRSRSSFPGELNRSRSFSTKQTNTCRGLEAALILVLFHNATVVYYEWPVKR